MATTNPADPTREQVLTALEVVGDPELGNRSVVELGMVRGVAICDGTVAVTLTITTAGCPKKNHFETEVRAAVGALDGVDTVNVRLPVMTAEERQALLGRLQTGNVPRTGAAPGANGSGTGAGNGTAVSIGGGGSAGVSEPALLPGVTVLAIASGKGGVGKSTTTANLALAMAARGRRVGILDADVYGYSIPRMLAVEGRPRLLDPLPGSERGRMEPRVAARGVQVMSIGFLVPDTDYPIAWRGPMLHRALTQFVEDVDWTGIDVLLVDMPPGTGDVSITVASALPSAKLVIVTTPQLAAQRVARRSALMGKRAGLTTIGVIENMSYFETPDGERHEIFGSGGGAILAEELEVPLLARIPLETPVRAGGDEGVPIVLSAPDSPAATALRDAADALLAATTERKPMRRIATVVA